MTWHIKTHSVCGVCVYYVWCVSVWLRVSVCVSRQRITADSHGDPDAAVGERAGGVGGTGAVMPAVVDNDPAHPACLLHVIDSGCQPQPQPQPQGAYSTVRTHARVSSQPARLPARLQ